MATPRERIEADLKAALKAGKKLEVSTLRMLLNDVKNEAIHRREEVDESGFLGLVRKAIKQRRESAESYRAGRRPELAEREEAEAELLAAYLPEEVGEDELRHAIQGFVEAEGHSGPGALGPVMKAMLGRFAGRADGGTINRIAREILAGKP